ncbi:MAG: aminopeptidase P family protein [Lactovum sp.]
MRKEKIKEKLEEIKVDGLIITDLKNIYYLTDFLGTSALILLTKEKDYFFTDDRYIEVANKQVKDMEIMSSRDPFSEIKKLSLNLKKVAFEDSLDFASYQELKKSLNCELYPSHQLFMEIRQIKEALEIKKIKKACQITDQAFLAVLNFIKVGKTELEVANFLDFKMRELGASGVSFETIVASGKRSALPHGVASQKVIEFADPITLDFGCFYQNYASDMTRTIFVGEVSDQMSKIYHTVKEANEVLIQKVKAGLAYSEVDRIPRELIEKAGYGSNFTHGIGHGFGLEVHEIPYFNQKIKDKFLKENMIITDEPGIYLEGFAGVRIEDDLLVQKNTCEQLTLSPKELIVI